jgi:NADH dehydrogenase (ubiquinone) 1 alpha subcomplex subunit 6
MPLQETLNFWKQLTHVLKYFRAEEDPKATLPKTFIAGFLQVRWIILCPDRQLDAY